MRQPVHSLADLEIHPSIDGDLALQVLLFDYVVGRVCKLETHVVVPFHWGIEVEVLDIYCHVADLFGGDGAVEMQLDGEQVDGGCAAVAGVVDPVSANCQSCPVGVLFGWPVAHHDASIRDILPAVGRDFFFVDEEDGVSALDSSRHALGESADFVAA